MRAMERKRFQSQEDDLKQQLATVASSLKESELRCTSLASEYEVWTYLSASIFTMMMMMIS
jgi:hypothetical protein